MQTVSYRDFCGFLLDEAVVHFGTYMHNMHTQIDIT